MAERLRAPLAALTALLISGEAAARGADAFGLWNFLFPYLFLFLAFEALSSRRRLDDAQAFLLGAAGGLLRDGLYAKTLQDGGLFLGVDFLGAAFTVLDWGMIAVLSLHAVEAVLPRPARAPDPRPEVAAAGGIGAAAVLVYLFKTFSGRYRYERYLGPIWLTVDLAFAGMISWLARRAWIRAGLEDAPPRDGWVWVLCAAGAWLTGAQVIYRASAGAAGFFGAFFLILWTVGAAWAARTLYAERGYADWSPRRAFAPALALAVWRALAALGVAWHFGAAGENPLAAGAFQLFVDLPSRALFFGLFFSGALAV